MRWLSSISTAMRILERLGIQTSSSLSKFDRFVLVNLKTISYRFRFKLHGLLFDQFSKKSTLYTYLRWLPNIGIIFILFKFGDYFWLQTMNDSGLSMMIGHELPLLKLHAFLNCTKISFSVCFHIPVYISAEKKTWLSQLWSFKFIYFLFLRISDFPFL